MRTLVWANPGKSGTMQSPRNWTQYASTADYLAKKDGRPAATPPDKNTDIILPDSPDGQSYVVACIERRKSDSGNTRLNCRHITIGKNAGLDGGCEFSRGRPAYLVGPNRETPIGVYGNVTVNDGGYIYGPHVFLGDKHTCFRIDKSPEPLGGAWVIDKSNDASVTLLSKKYELAGGITVRSGRLVLSSGAHLSFGAGRQGRIELKKHPKNRMPGKEEYVCVHRTGALEMHAGSCIGRARAPEAVVADLRIEGGLQIGRPGEKSGRPAVIELGLAKGGGGFLAQHGGLYICPWATFKNFGRLAITSYDRQSPASADKGISLFLEKAVDLGDVSFDYLRAGGIVAIDKKAARAATAGASFGKHCAARGDKLLAKLGLIRFSGGVGTVELVDGLKTECKILFPHAGRLIVRGRGNRTLQSFDLKSVHAVTINGKRTEFSAKRPLNDAEKQLRKTNALWGDTPGKGQYGKYGKQEWPDCTVAIWARPGESGACAVGPNWLDETGTPHFASPLVLRREVGSDTPPVDVLMPASESPYLAVDSYTRGGDRSPLQRHVTIERNACYGTINNIHGNLWMKYGSGMNGLTGSKGGEFANLQPGLHRFLRFDGKRIPYRGRGVQAPLVDSYTATLAQFGYFAAGRGGTLELIGQIRSAGDRLSIGGTGATIISDGSELHEGSRSALWILEGATLALLQDAFAGTEMTQQRPQCYASMIVSGTLMIGLPDRPIVRDTRFALSGIRRDLINRDPGFSVRSTGSSFVLGRQGRFVIHSADPKKARVIFTLHDSKRALARDAAYRAKASKARDMTLWNPEGIVCYFAGRTEIDGILFDKVYPGGIIATPEARAKWKNVFYGRDNLAAPEKLYSDLKTKDSQ
ncbi:MAG: hypothetical protein HN350_06195 [Phycisphaerales bacterium]|nr:hypothetical protein [Phycisphaerales bacterium]